MQIGSFGRVLPVLLSASNTGLRQPHEQAAWTAPSSNCWIAVEWYTALVSHRRATGQLIVCVPPPGARARDVTSLAGSPISRVPARTMASQGAAMQGVSETPGVTTAAVPTWAWTGM